MPIFSRCLNTSVDLSAILVPSKYTSPFVGVSKRFIVRRKVDLPEPDGPIITTTSPFLIWISRPFRTSFLSNDLYKFLISIKFGAVILHILSQVFSQVN